MTYRTVGYLVGGAMIAIAAFVAIFTLDLYDPYKKVATTVSLMATAISLVGGILIGLGMWQGASGAGIWLRMLARFGAAGVAILLPGTQIHTIEEARLLSEVKIVYMVEAINMISYFVAVIGFIAYLYVISGVAKRHHCTNIRRQLNVIAVGIGLAATAIATSGHLGEGLVAAAAHAGWLGCFGLLVGVMFYGWSCIMMMYLVPELLKAERLCGTCGYNLAANVSGRCPECGMQI